MVKFDEAKSKLPMNATWDDMRTYLVSRWTNFLDDQVYHATKVAIFGLEQFRDSEKHLGGLRLRRSARIVLQVSSLR
jgi:hypothetical protein